jgi:tetratricopeptide (TPR) repeat protein
MAKRSQAAKTVAKRTRPGKPAAVKKTSARKKAAGKHTASSRTTLKAASRKTAARKPAPARTAAPSGRTRGSASVAPPPRPRRPAAAAVAAPAPAPPVAVRKPGFYEAVAIYERGVQALQRHDYDGAAGFFRAILERYPEERELLERARLYLRVCERETARQPAGPKTPAERVYAATVALNSGDHSGALDHLQRALGEDPESDHAHYIMAVALGMRGRADEAVDHLRRAIGLNPDNRGLAREDPDLESIRNHEHFGSALNTPPAANRRRPPRRH